LSGIHNSKMNFSKFYNRYSGQRCFILGGAPSLKNEQLELLKNEKVFICNKGFKALEIGLDHYDFYVLADASVARENYDQIETQINSPRFYSSSVARKVDFTHDYIKYIRGTGKPHVALPTSVEAGWGKVGTVVLDATILAYLMGFKEIYLLGTDLDYSANNTHFYPDDQREIRQRNIMNMKLVLRNLKGVSKQLALHNVIFRNLSQGFNHKNICPVDRLQNII
jgi:hypothetical protein